MPIENRILEPGTVLTARYKKEDRTCEVVETAEGLRYRLDDGTEHKSPSSAGKAATGGACNGWIFWSLAETEKPQRESEAAADKPAKESAKKSAKAKAAKSKGKTKAQKTGKTPTIASDAPFGCDACSETFPTEDEATEHATMHAN